MRQSHSECLVSSPPEQCFSYLLDSTFHQAATALAPRVNLSFTNNRMIAWKFLFLNLALSKTIKDYYQMNAGDVLDTPTTHVQWVKKKSLLDFSASY